MKIIPIVLTLLCAIPVLAQTSERVIGLDELFRLADSQSKSIKIFETAVIGADKDIDIAKNAYLPDIKFSASATYNGNAWVADRDFSNGQTFKSPHLRPHRWYLPEVPYTTTSSCRK